MLLMLFFLIFASSIKSIESHLASESALSHFLGYIPIHNHSKYRIAGDYLASPVKAPPLTQRGHPSFLNEVKKKKQSDTGSSTGYLSTTGSHASDSVRGDNEAGHVCPHLSRKRIRKLWVPGLPATVCETISSVLDASENAISGNLRLGCCVSGWIFVYDFRFFDMSSRISIPIFFRKWNSFFFLDFFNSSIRKSN